MLKAVRDDVEEKSRQTKTADTEFLATIAGWVGVKGRSGVSTAPRRLSFAALADTLPGPQWPCAVCVMIDEIQNVKAPGLDVLEQMHLGEHGLPIVPVLAGLGNALDALDGIGLSRMADESVRGIGALSPEEAAVIAERMLDECGVDRAGANFGWPAWLAERSEGWPQHLHNGMAALAQELVRAGGALSDVGGAAVEALESRRRERSYSRRVSWQMDSSVALVAGTLDNLTGGAPPEADTTWTAAEIEWHIRGLAEENADRAPGWALPDGMTAPAFFGHLVHKGVFHRDGKDGPYVCPIPSLASYLVRRGRGRGTESRPKEADSGLPAPTPYDN